MKTTLSLIASLLSLVSSQAFAHAAPVAHPETSNGLLHSLMHFGVLIPVGVGVFLLSRWLLRRNQH